MKIYRIYDKDLEQAVDLEARMTTLKKAKEALTKLQDYSCKYSLGDPSRLEIRHYECRYR